MLKLVIPAREVYDETNDCFISTQKDTVLQLEHSLLSVAKWEAIYKKPFIDKNTKTYQESIDYIRCMTITQNVNPDVYKLLTKEMFDAINAYIDEPMTATTFSKNAQGGSGIGRNGEKITAELIYYWMIALGIPFECQKWHLKRLLTLIEVCSIKNGPQKKMSQKDTIMQYKALNEQRRLAHKTRG